MSKISQNFKDRIEKVSKYSEISWNVIKGAKLLQIYFIKNAKV